MKRAGSGGEGAEGWDGRGKLMSVGTICQRRGTGCGEGEGEGDGQHGTASVTALSPCECVTSRFARDENTPPLRHVTHSAEADGEGMGTS